MRSENEGTEPILPMGVLKPLCQPFSRQADSLLELFEMTHRAGHPGRCLACFFQLKKAGSAISMAKLAPLQDWIERHIEIDVQTDSPVQRSLPLDLRAPDLESFCTATLQAVHKNPEICEPCVELFFRFKQSA